MADFKYEVKYIKSKNPETIAGFNNMYIGLKFYENFVERAMSEKWDERWSVQYVETDSGKLLSEVTN